MLGRFTSPDSIIPDPGSVIGYNRFAYVNNNPMRYTDPSGHGADGGIGDPTCSPDDPACKTIWEPAKSDWTYKPPITCSGYPIDTSCFGKEQVPEESYLAVGGGYYFLENHQYFHKIYYYENGFEVGQSIIRRDLYWADVAVLIGTGGLMTLATALAGPLVEAYAIWTVIAVDTGIAATSTILQMIFVNDNMDEVGLAIQDAGDDYGDKFVRPDVKVDVYQNISHISTNGNGDLEMQGSSTTLIVAENQTTYEKYYITIPNFYTMDLNWVLQKEMEANYEK